jgi:hypothetical protein
MNISWGALSEKQAEIVRRYVSRRVVHDLGAGPYFSLSHQLVGLGAKQVIAVDQRISRARRFERIRCVRSKFDRFEEPVRTAFVSWPVNTKHSDLVRLLEGAKTVIYLGSNMDGTVCGGRPLWAHLRARKVLEHEPHPRNTLIVYGGRLRSTRELLFEEAAGLDDVHTYSFAACYPEHVNLVAEQYTAMNALNRLLIRSLGYRATHSFLERRARGSCSAPSILRDEDPETGTNAPSCRVEGYARERAPLVRRDESGGVQLQQTGGSPAVPEAIS